MSAAAQRGWVGGWRRGEAYHTQLLGRRRERGVRARQVMRRQREGRGAHGLRGVVDRPRPRDVQDARPPLPRPRCTAAASN